MGVTYDTLRNMDNPIAPVSKYYRSQLKAGESYLLKRSVDILYMDV